MEKALKLYYLDHVDDLKDLNDNGTLAGCGTGDIPALKEGVNSVSVSDLINQGYISDNETKIDNAGNRYLVDPSTNDKMEGCVSVTWICSKKQYEYKFIPDGTCD